MISGMLVANIRVMKTVDWAAHTVHLRQKLVQDAIFLVFTINVIARRSPRIEPSGQVH